MIDEVEPKPSTWRIRLMGVLLAAGIGAVLGALSVPNSVVPIDTPEMRLRVAAAAALATVPWAFRFAPKLFGHPLRMAVQMALGTYLLGFWAMGICGVDVPAGPVDFYGLSLLYVAWIVAGASSWCVAMLFLPAMETRLTMVVQTSGWAPGVARWRAALLSVVAMASLATGLSTRHFGWTLPSLPDSSRSVVVMRVSDGGPTGGRCHAGPADGPSLFNYVPCPTGGYYLTTEPPSSWGCVLDRHSEGQVSGWSCFGYTDVWDDGDSVRVIVEPYLPLAIVLKKAPAFDTGRLKPYRYGSEVVYRDVEPILNEAGEVVALFAPALGYRPGAGATQGPVPPLLTYFAFVSK